MTYVVVLCVSVSVLVSGSSVSVSVSVVFIAEPARLIQAIVIDAFNENKGMIKTEAKLVFQDFKKPFNLYINASHIQLGATLVQEGKLL